jgi:hypothetical protein
MPPSTVVGLVFLAAALSPGLVYHRALARYLQRDQRSTAIEIVELGTVGVIASSISVVVVAGLAELVPAFVTLDELFGDPRAVGHEPWRAVAAVGSALVLSYLLSAAAGVLVARRSAERSGRMREGSAWSGVLAKRKDGRPAFLAVEIDDGRLIEGFFRTVSVTGDPARDVLALKGPIAFSGPGKVQRKAVEDDFVLIPRSIVKAIRGKYVPPKPKPSPQQPS